MFNNIYRGKKIIVTGHTGFKGSWLTLWLKKLGAEVIGISLDPPSIPSHFESLGIRSEIKDFHLDIRNHQGMKSIFNDTKPDLAFHLAAMPIVRECYDHPVEAFSTNVMGSIHFLDCVNSSPSLKAAVLVTSDKCYKNQEWVYGYRETDLLGGEDPYSASKACAEIAFASFFKSYLQTSGKCVASVRAGNVVGGGDWAKDRIVPDSVRAWSENKIVTMRSPNATRPWQHVLEPISGYLWLGALLLKGGQNLNGESFNFGPRPENDFTVLELIKAMQPYWPNSQYQIIASEADHKKESHLLKLACEKANNRLGWKPILDFHETANLTSQWYSQFYNNENILKASLDQIELYENLGKKLNLAWAE